MMGTWHYQLMRHRVNDEVFGTEVWYEIHEYYPTTRKNGKGSWTKDSIAARGASRIDTIKALQNMTKDCMKHGIRDYDTGKLIEE